LKRIPNWHVSNQMPFHLVLRSNQSQFLVVFKFFVHHVFQLAIHFHRIHLKLIPN
jgi:hypothetical protein